MNHIYRHKVDIHNLTVLIFILTGHVQTSPQYQIQFKDTQETEKITRCNLLTTPCQQVPPGDKHQHRTVYLRLVMIAQTGGVIA